ncbi:SpoIIE family protein phosphatase [Paenibacillus sp. HB172176]|uniref:SpoIIE family protein phosphatase n=1 Tax=Paenibacillus sp. HB172176 TaxID=2493690 RepID=UPI00143A49FD|nr:SpoIIE family protein phosphatase [Paenibacillus sp. HB172176]
MSKDAIELPESGVIFEVKMDSGIRRVMLLASTLIAVSIILLGSWVYGITERAALHKLKTRDLQTLASSISAQVDGRIDRAVETSLALSHDPAVLDWLAGREQNQELARMVSGKTSYMHGELGYDATFIVGAATRNYWDYEGNLLSVIDEKDPADTWFFDTLSAAKEVSINFDYNPELGGTYAFVNVLAGRELSKPLGIVGVGMKLDELTEEFASYKDGRGINLWLVSRNGDIYLSDDWENNGRNISDVLPESAIIQLAEADVSNDEPFILDYDRPHDGKMDLIAQPLRSTDFRLLVEVERSETTGFLQTIRWNTVFAAFITMLAAVVFFFYVSRRIANPYKRALELNRRLEGVVELRTKELSDRNREMLDSVNYARLLQQSVLPKPDELARLLDEPFVIWRPRDVVSGDFFWIKHLGDRTLVAVGDCTGHGVPGAFMTMLALSTLNRIAEKDDGMSPASLLEELNRLIKETLHHEDEEGITDDGLSIGLCAVDSSGALVFAGASCRLYRLEGEELLSWKGDRQGIGYRRTPSDFRYTDHDLPAGKARFYMTTDGFTDQNGGDRDYPYGRKRFEELLRSIGHLDEIAQQEKMTESLEAYMRGERQRDDITVLSFRALGNGERTGESQ